MTLPQITLDLPTLKLILSIVGGLLLLAMIRIVFLLRTNNRLRESAEKMERQVLTQHNEILAVRQDSNAWRGEIQRMFDAFRAEFSKRLGESEERYQQAQKRAGGTPSAGPSAPGPAPAAAPAPAPAAAPAPPPAPAAPAAETVPKTEPLADETVDPLPALTLS